MAGKDPKTLWGWVSGIAAATAGAVVAVPAGLVAGTVSVAKGGTFEEGSSKVGDAYGKFIEGAAEAGDDHGKAMTGALLKGAAQAAGAAAVNKTLGQP